MNPYTQLFNDHSQFKAVAANLRMSRPCRDASPLGYAPIAQLKQLTTPSVCQVPVFRRRGIKYSCRKPQNQSETRVIIYLTNWRARDFHTLSLRLISLRLRIARTASNLLKRTSRLRFPVSFVVLFLDGAVCELDNLGKECRHLVVKWRWTTHHLPQIIRLHPLPLLSRTQDQ